MNINYITLAQNLQRLMDEKGVDRNKLCDDLGLKYVTVSSWLEARKYPRVDKIEMLAKYFGVSKAHLTEHWYTQIEGVPHLYDSKKSAPADEGKSEKKKDLTSRQKRIVKLFDELTEPQQDNIIGRAELLAEQNENESAEEGAG